MTYGANYNRYTQGQIEGSEYGGVGRTLNTVQPKGADALSAADKLRLGYLTGDTTDSLHQSILSLEDRRQMMGLKPSGDVRPIWLSGTGRLPEAAILGAEYPDDLAAMDNEPPPLGG